MRSSFHTASTPGLPTRGQRALILLMLAAMIGALIARQGLAQESGKTIMLGESLSEAEQTELLDYFNAGPDDRIETVTLAETQAAMEGVIDLQIGSAYSSTSLACRDLGDGLEVKTRNITVITPSLFAIALVTAGLGDGELLVAAPNAAAAQGLAALTGVFKTWAIAPCASGDTTEARQDLALEELALAVEISNVLTTPNPIEASGNLVLYVQQAVVIDGLTTEDEISAAVAAQEAALNITVPAEQRAKLIDFMVRLAAEEIDWSTFSAGWVITPTGDGTGISMKGDGIAIRNAQLTATARAADEMTQTAIAADVAAQQTATARAALDAESAMMTATAEAANALATEQALSAAMTATANAIPTATIEPTPSPTPSPTPEPTATPEPFALSGTIDHITGSQIFMETADGDTSVGYSVTAGAAITRGDAAATLSELKRGDRVTLTIDPVTQTVSQIQATAVASGGFAIGKFLFLLPALAVIPLILFLKSRDLGGDPFVVKRVASA